MRKDFKISEIKGKSLRWWNSNRSKILINLLPGVKWM